VAGKLTKKGRLDLDRLASRFIVPPGHKVSLSKDYVTRLRHPISKEELQQQLSQGVAQLAREQDKLSAENKQSLLIILQAMDAAGKDSTIKHVMSGLNPQGCQVKSFKAPSSEELDHDYMWRYAKSLPERGCIGIFNRSYYEEVLVVRVHPEILEQQQLPDHLKDKKIWHRRFEEINNLEKHLTDNGTAVLKFFLYLSKEEQKRRFLSRIDMPDKNWKFSADDARDRRSWKDYIDAYEDCFEHTSSKWAPWYVIPADEKPVTRLCVAHIVQKTLKSLGAEYPNLSKSQRLELVQAKKILLEEK
jgi:PPK2 family polyphosphate:nucleotide phosphotransferase